MPPYSVIFCGTPAFALPSLQTLIDDTEFSVDLVISQPDRPVGRKQTLTPPPVKTLAEKHSIPVWQPQNINKEWEAKTGDIKKPDYLVVVSFGQILSESILDFPTIAPVNVHPSLLPKWRGASPYQSSILAGDRETGVTIQRLVKKLDAGPILAQISQPIDPRETSETLHDRLADTGATLLVQTLKKPLQETEQDEQMATYCSRFSRADGQVDPTRMTAEDIDRNVRALHPWPGVRCLVDDTELKLIETALTPTEESIALPCAQETVVHLVNVQPPNKKVMSGRAWQRGKK